MIDRSDLREYTALAAVAQGTLAALAPRVVVWAAKRALGWNYENTTELKPRPAYLRQIRAGGIGLAAAGVAGFTMERIAGDAASASDAAEAVDADGVDDGTDGTDDGTDGTDDD